MTEVVWYGIKDPLKREITIGAVGFIGNDIVSIVSFFDDKDPNRDGEVGWGEWIAGSLSPIGVNGKALTEVAMAAKQDSRIFTKDLAILTMANKIFAEFASNLVMDGVYAVYFKGGVKMIGGGIAKSITSSMVKGFIIRKGFEKAAKEAFKSSTR